MQNILRPFAALAAAVAIAVPAAAHAQDKPITPKQVAKNIRSETHRAANRTQDAVRKAGNQTEAQAHRTGKSVERAVSRDERREARGDTLVTSSSHSYAVPKDEPPVTPEQVGKNVRSETHRAANRTEDAVRKAGNQTEAQAHRTGKALKKVVSRKARHDTTE